MKVLITGSAGYLGTVAMNHLSARGYEIVGMDMVNRDNTQVAANRFYKCDITDRRAVAEIFERESPDAVIHFAATTNKVRDRKKEYEIDVGGTRNLLETARHTPSIRKFIYSSSAAIYGASPGNRLWLDETMPVNPGRYRYGMNKKMTEELLFSENGNSGLHVVSLRICTVVGPFYSKPRSVVSILMRFPLFPASFRNTCVQFIHEEDFATMIGNVLDDNEIEGLFNLAPDSCTVVSDVVPAERFHRFPCRVLLPVMWLLWHLRLVNLQPAGLSYSLYPVVMSSARLAGRYNYNFTYSSSEAFLDACRHNRLPAGAKF